MSETTKKYFFTYEESDEEGAGPRELFNKILEDSELPDLKHIIVGYWGECFEEDPQQIINGIIANKEKFAHIETLFFGDMEYDECEVSWIIQGNYEKLFEALPNLKGLTIKGATDLTIGKNIRHEKLEELEIICGGLDVQVIRDIAEADFPALKTLNLYLGVDNYGLNAEIEDFQELINKAHFPALRHLGLLDSEMQNELAGMIIQSDLLPQLETLDLSFGIMSDEGGAILYDNKEKLSGLKKLEIDHHYMTDEMVKKLETLPFEVNITDQCDSNERYKSPILTE